VHFDDFIVTSVMSFCYVYGYSDDHDALANLSFLTVNWSGWL